MSARYIIKQTLPGHAPWEPDPEEPAYSAAPASFGTHEHSLKKRVALKLEAPFHEQWHRAAVKMQIGNLTGKRFAQCPVWPRESRAYPSSRQQHTLRWPTLKENLSHVSFFSDFLGQVGSDVHVFSPDFGRFWLNFGVILAPF